MLLKKTGKTIIERSRSLTEEGTCKLIGDVTKTLEDISKTGIIVSVMMDVCMKPDNDQDIDDPDKFSFDGGIPEGIRDTKMFVRFIEFLLEYTNDWNYRTQDEVGFDIFKSQFIDLFNATFFHCITSNPRMDDMNGLLEKYDLPFRIDYLADSGSYMISREQ